MKRIAYAQQVIGTDERVGDLLMEYATLLARAGSADTVAIPCRIGTGEVAPVAVLVGPASQITAWSDDDPFDADASEAVADLERRISAVRGDGEPDGGMTAADDSRSDPGPGAIDAFDDLA